jgi:hypothetical protein
MNKQPELTVRAIPAEFAEKTHQQLTVGIGHEEVARWNDGTVKGKTLDCFIESYQPYDPVLVRCSGRGHVYEVWIRKEAA